MTFTIVGPEAEAKLDWLALTDALAAGHALPRAEVADTILQQGGNTLLTRSAWIAGMGIAVKAATIYPGPTSTSTTWASSCSASRSSGRTSPSASTS